MTYNPAHLRPWATTVLWQSSRPHSKKTTWRLSPSPWSSHGFNTAMKTFHIKVLAFACPRATLSIRRDYRRPLPAWLFNISFRKSCLIGWRRETPIPPLLYYGQRAPKRYASLQTSLTSSIFRASELPYWTWRTLSALHSPRYAPPPSYGRSLKRPSALLAHRARSGLKI